MLVGVSSMAGISLKICAIFFFDPHRWSRPNCAMPALPCPPLPTGTSASSTRPTTGCIVADSSSSSVVAAAEAEAVTKLAASPKPFTPARKGKC